MNLRNQTIVAVIGTCLGISGATTPTPAHATTWPVDAPVATGLPNPGVVHTGSEWVMLTTGNWDSAGNSFTASELKGPWTSTGRRLLTAKPAWMSNNTSVWAPSIIRASDGSYRIFFAGLVAGETHSRCIGTGYSTNPHGPFEPYDRALACYYGSGANAHDTIVAEGPGFTLIDPTPSWVGSQLVLTYKTGYRADSSDPWHTTTRMVRLDPDQPQRILPNPIHADGGSIKLTDSVHKYIEENPVMVAQGGRFTLFNSFGWFGTCDYWTRYRQNGSLWSGWLDKSPTALPFPSGMNTCGTGNAHIAKGLPEDSWRILFNGHPNSETAAGPDGLYVGALDWDANGAPRVTAILR